MRNVFVKHLEHGGKSDFIENGWKITWLLKYDNFDLEDFCMSIQWWTCIVIYD